MPLTYNETSLWSRTLGASGSNSREESALAVLRSTFETAHERMKPIVRQAHLDCKGLTIHDETHLDALWQLADTIAGDSYPINPLEAFVFGCSVLFHDSALAVAAYEGGLEELKRSPEWERAVIQMAGTNDLARTSLPADKIAHIESVALFSVLRILHAKQASTIVERQWERPDNKPPIYILEDTEIRDYYGQIIGRIAQSHHWDIDRVAREFATRRAPPPSLPAEWELNELKIALLLRCSDAAHIDQRRAPLMEYVLASPKGLSALHWNFQNRLGTPKRGDSSILYNSGRDFGRSEADAWWLCYDTCRMISSELQNAAGVLKESDSPPFFATRVEGVQRPKLFARFVHWDGWEPVDAEVRVTDPISLAQTLGGRNLYGSGLHAPVREMLQNAIDAALYRYSAGREGFSPKVRLTLDRDEHERLRIIVEDNGIGMSERVLTKRLLDFGRSGWRSDDVAQDNPEISMAKIRPSGKFGIGFFAIFLLGDDVSVVTRSYKGGFSDGLALEFVGLSRRPILRKATAEDQNDIFNTRITVVISDESAVRGLMPKARVDNSLRKRSYSRFPYDEDFFVYLRWLVASSGVDMEFIDKVGDRSFSHSANWAARSSEEFIRDLTGEVIDRLHDNLAELYSDRLSNLEDDDGRLVGRAAILVGDHEARFYEPACAMVGGLTYPVRQLGQIGTSSTSVVPRYVGVIEGEAAIATRGNAQLAISTASLARWATGQALLGSRSGLSIIEKLELAASVYWAGGDPQQLPIAFFEGKMVDLPTFRKILSERKDIFLPLSMSGSSEYIWQTADDLGPRHFLDRMINGICIMSVKDRETSMRRRADDTEIKLELNAAMDDDIVSLIDFGSYRLMLDIVAKLGRKYLVRYEVREIFSEGINFSKGKIGLSVTFEDVSVA